MEGRVRILLVEDDPRLAGLIRDYLELQGFEVLIEGRGDTASGRLFKEKPDLLILDLMLPGMDGHTVCRTVRSKYQGPILILTAREDDMDQVVGLELGADDYVKKPIEPRVLLARIRALLRRVENNTNPNKSSAKFLPETEQDIHFGGLRICSSSHSAFLNNEQIELTTTEFKLLCYLAANAGRVLEREQIFSAIRGIDYDGLDRSVDIAVSRLRKKLEIDPSVPKRIKTLWGQGYVFVKDAW
ncbi:winged helix-turn-helix domain-containing protein [Psychromonas aquimarina]|uniref:winged helix-turn-helix domain-containing protein n=1 Tax=Psychromonas aquimarina TaxID=444919 RepID=UPI000410E42F|nr:winged helix-turn-helix domain-containing protein [Psychromonas aquimarina]